MFSSHRLLYIILLYSTSIIGESISPWCHCVCCPGEQCTPQVQKFSTHVCDQKTCSFERCYRMYPDKCGLIPGITNHSCHQHSRLGDTQTPVELASTGSWIFDPTTMTPLVFVTSVMAGLHFYWWNLSKIKYRSMQDGQSPEDISEDGINQKNERGVAVDWNAREYMHQSQCHGDPSSKWGQWNDWVASVTAMRRGSHE